MTLPNPKKLTDHQLWHIILNIWPKKAPREVKKWYQRVESEFFNRKVELIPIIT